MKCSERVKRGSEWWQGGLSGLQINFVRRHFTTGFNGLHNVMHALG